MSKVRRIYVEKKEPYAVAARQLKEDILGFLAVKGLTGVRKLIRYDVENVSDEVFETACKTVFSEPPVDILYRETIDVPKDGFVFSVEALPGQFDQRADSAVQCVQFLNENENPVIKTAETYILTGTFTEDEIDRIKKYCINPVDSRETGMEKPATLQTEYPQADDVQVLTGMTTMYEDELTRLYKSLGLAMTYNDFLFIQKDILFFIISADVPNHGLCHLICRLLYPYERGKENQKEQSDPYNGRLSKPLLIVPAKNIAEVDKSQDTPCGKNQIRFCCKRPCGP